MNLYVKGALIAAVLVAVIFVVYQRNVEYLPVNQAPAGFKLINQMEKEGVPDFELERLDGTKLKLSEYKGKVLIVNFWASWCNPCVEEFPSMVKLAQSMSDDVQIIAIATDDDKKDVEAFAKLFKLPMKGFDVVWDKEKAVMAKYDVNKIPESFLVRRDFTLVRKVLGIENWASEQALEYFASLAGKTPPAGATPAAQGKVGAK